MELQEANNLKIGDIVFVIGKDNNIYKKIVIGIKLLNHKSINITYIDPGEKHMVNAFFRPHNKVFIREKDALACILLVYKKQFSDLDLKIHKIETKIKKLECEETNKHIEKYGE